MISDADFSALLDHYDRSWRGYRKVRKGPMKRVSKHMELLGCSSIKEYLEVLDENGQEQQVLLSLLRITISRFYRDRELWSCLTEFILPRLVEQNDALKVWSAGCCCGEEAYSLNILHQMQWADCSSLEILATDANELCLERAQAGIYNKSSLRELEAGMLSSCFDRSVNPDEYIIKQKFKNGIAWKHHDFFSALPGRNFHIVFLRNNLLTYHSPDAQAEVLERILQSMLPGGFLLIGCHEKLPARHLNLKPTACDMIYQLL